MTPDYLAANLVTVTDIAVRTGSPEDAAELWVHLPAFPRLLVPEIAGGRVWWWPDVRDYILARAAKLPGYVSPTAVKPASRPRPAGKRGADPGPRILTAFDLRVLEAMHGQVDDQDRPRFTLEQIAAAMSGNVTATTIMHYAPASRRRSGRGGDSRALEPERIAEMRALRAETTQDEKPRYTLRQLAARFGVSDISASRYCRDIQPGGPVTPRRRRQQPFDAEGHPITVEQVERVQAMRAERDDAGAHRYTREQVAEACGVSVATVKRLERRLTGPPGAPRHLDAVSFPDPPLSAPRSREIARQHSRSGTPGRSPLSPPGRPAR
jgi:hypothetical protein